MPRLTHRRAVMLGRLGGRATARMHAQHRRAGILGARVRWHRYRRVKGYYQIGKSNVVRDRKRLALHPGKRVSASGRVYYEHRRNRSDMNRRLRL